ncbi:relaxase/mobilization nuclease domain-containing protein [Phenylobacterium sp.]|uniref:relaxase/mobilization nuclease domain-containing protein n=1 Tax=Phenylobacterium sp. TaxID=1871053 RepID=UPI002FCBAA55
MTEIRPIRGFEDIWRPVANHRAFAKDAIIATGSPIATKARLARIVVRAPEVVVKVTGATRGAKGLKAHLDYISRRGDLPLEGRGGEVLVSRQAQQELAADWAWGADVDGRRQERTPLSRSLVVSMPEGVSPDEVFAAAREFVAASFGQKFDYVLAPHLDVGHPHVHVAVRALGDSGERLNPSKADLDQWRQTFAEALRVRGVEAEATPRRARGVVIKSERTTVRMMRERHELGLGDEPRVLAAAREQAARAASEPPHDADPWNVQLRERWMTTRAAYGLAAKLLAKSPDPADQALSLKVASFALSMPAPENRFHLLAKELREARARGPANREHQIARDEGHER